MKWRSPAVFTVVGVGATLAVTAVVVVVLLRFGGGAKAVSDNAALIGALIALGGVFTTQMVNSALEAQRAQQAQNTEQAQRQREFEVAQQRARDDALQSYIDQMSQLLTDEVRPLHQAHAGDSLSTVARARTLSALTRLDGERKASVLQFLYESELINANRVVVELAGADLSFADLGATPVVIVKSDDQSGGDDSREGGFFLREANLRETILQGAYLSGADLRRADLSGANLVGTDLRYANLSEALLCGATMGNTLVHKANLSSADLTGAKLVNTDELESNALSLEGATMPNGQKYEDWLKDREGREEDAEND